MTQKLEVKCQYTGCKNFDYWIIETETTRAYVCEEDYNKVDWKAVEKRHGKIIFKKHYEF